MPGSSDSKLFRTTTQLRPDNLEELAAVMILNILTVTHMVCNFRSILKDKSSRESSENE